MVKVSLASIIDSMGVKLELDSGSIDGDRDWLFADGSSKLVAVSFSNLNVGSKGVILGGIWVLVAFLLVSLVWIAGNVFNSVLKNVFISPLDDSSVASQVSLSGRTVNEFLLRVIDKSVVLKGSPTGETLRSREGPT